LVLAVADGVEVGVDIEKIDADKPVSTMARLAFSQREQADLSALPILQQIQAFYHCWVRKEACMKASGRGFSLPGSSFNVPVCLKKLPLQTLINCNQSFWHVQDIDVPGNYYAAVAVAADSVSPSPPAIVRVAPKT
jgi:4'-phosphopantetheinyl transferase